MFIRKQPTRISRALALWIVLSHLTSFVAPALANPGGGSVTAGGASISSSGTITTINQSTDRAVINWQTFSNSASETVNFQQPASSSVTLNRVTGPSHSQLDGSLNANGRVFILNPNGVVFGKTANVKVNGLLTSTLDMNDDAGFMAGKNAHSLSQNPSRARSAVVNQGRIEAGDGGVALVAPVVNNQGQIVAALGHVSLAGTTKAVVNYDQQGLVNVAIPAGKGGRGDVTLPVGASSELLEDAAVAPGVVEAGAITRMADGRIVLRNAEGLAVNEGSITARMPSGNGGNVQVHGTQAAILGRSSSIDTSGTGRGNAGSVSVTSGGIAITMKGSRIVARGGDQGGDGGQVDVSAPRLSVKGKADVTAPKGNPGLILLDPNDIVVVDDGTGGGGCTTDNATLASTGVICGATNADPSQISVGVIEAFAGPVRLTANNSITINDITSDGVINLQPGTTLTLQAGTGNITMLNQANHIAATGGGGLVVQAGGTATLGIIDASGGTVSITAPGGISTAAITADALNLTTNGVASQIAGGAYTIANLLTVAGSTPGGGTFNLNTENNSVAELDSAGQIGTIRFRSDAGIAVGTLQAASTVELATNGAVAVSTNIVTNNLQATSVAGGTGDFDLTVGVDANSVSTTNQVNTLAVTDANGFAVAGISAATSVTLNSNGSVTQTGAIVAPTLTLASTGGAADFALASANNDVTNLVTTTGMNTLAFRDDNGFDVNPAAAGFTTSLALTSSNAVSESAPIKTPLLTLSTAGAASGTFNLNTQNNDVGTVTTGNQVDTVNFEDDNGFAVGTIAAAGSVLLKSDGVVTQTGAITSNSIVLEATTAGQGTFQLDTQNNNVNSVTSNNQVGTLAFRDDNGFDVALNAAGAATSITLTSNGTVTESAPIITPALTVTGTGPFNLNGQNNDVTTLNASLGAIGTARFRDDNGFTLGTVAAGTLELITDTTVTDAGGSVTVGSLILTSTAGNTGNFSLSNTNEAITVVSSSNTIDQVSLRADGGFAVAGITAQTSVTLRSQGIITQSGPIVAPLLTLTDSTPGSLRAQLSSRNNDVGTVTTTNNLRALLFRDDTGFNVGTVSANAITLVSDNAVTQSGVISSSGTLTLSSIAGNAGNFQLDTQNNAVAGLATTVAVDQIRFQDNAGFDVSGASAQTSILLQSNGTVTSSGAGVTTATLTLQATTAGQGNFQLAGVASDVTTLATGNQVASLAFRDDNGFDVALAAGGVTGTLLLDSDSTVTQSAPINALVLQMRDTAGNGSNFAFNTQNNDVGQIQTQGTVGAAAFRDDTGFNVGASSVTNVFELQTDNTVTGTAAISAGTLILTSTSGGTGAFGLSAFTNTLGTVQTSNQIGSATVLGTTYVIGTANAAVSLDFQGTGAVSQTGAITTPVLTVGGGGDIDLSSQNNDVTSFGTSSSVNSLRFRDDNGYAVSGITAVGTATLITDTTVTQSGAINADLVLTGTNAGNGTFTLDTVNNTIGTLGTGNQINSARVLANSGFVVTGVDAATSLTLSSKGIVTEGGAINTPALVLASATNGTGIFRLASQNNNVGAVSTANQVNTVQFRNDASYNVGALDASVTVLLQSNGTVNQTAPITTALLVVRSDGSSAGLWFLDSQNNVVTNFSARAKPLEVHFRDDSGFNVAGANLVDMFLTSNGTVTESAPMTGQRLFLTPQTAGSGNFTLNTQNNDFTTVITTNQVNSLAYRDDNGFGFNPFSSFVTSLALQSNGAVTQTQPIVAPLVTLTATTAGQGNFNLGQNNQIGTFATTNQVGTVTVRDDANLTLGTTSANALTVRSNGTVNETGIVTAGTLTLTGSAGAGDFVLDTQNNDFGTVQSGATVHTIALRDDGAYTLGAISANTSITLRTNGAVDQTGAITTPSLVVASSSLNGVNRFVLDSQNNAVTTVSTANLVGRLAFRDDAGFDVGSVNSVAAEFTSAGTVTQSAPLNSGSLFLSGTTASQGAFNFDTQNNTIGVLSSNQAVGTMKVRGDGGFSLFGQLTASSATFVSDASVTQLNSNSVLTIGDLRVRATTVGKGDFTFSTPGNAVGTINTENKVNTLLMRADGGFAVGAVSANTRVTLSSAGNVTEVAGGSLVTPGLELQGSGNYTLNSAVDVDVVAANVTGGTITLADIDDLTIGSVISTGISTHGGALNLTSGGLAVNSSVDLGAGNGVITSSAPVTMAGGAVYAANALSINAGASNAIGSAGARFNTRVNSLNVSDASGNGSGGAALFLNEADALTLTARVGSTFDAIVGGNLALVNVTTGSSGSAKAQVAGGISLGTVSTGTYDIRAAGSIVDANGAADNLVSTGAGRLQVTGASSVIGSVADPVDVNQSGSLTLDIAGQVAGVSGAINGSLAGGIIIDQAPGLVFFNGFPINISVFQLVTTALGQGAAGAILSAGGQLSDLVEVASDASEDVQTDDSEAEKRRRDREKKPAKPVIKTAVTGGAKPVKTAAVKPVKTAAARKPAAKAAGRAD